MTDLLIVGGGAAGATAAQFARKNDRKMGITMLNSEEYPMYSRCALPYMINDKVHDPVEFKREWYEKNGIELKLGCRVKSIDLGSRVAEYEGKENGKIEYDRLIIATGSSPFVPPVFREIKRALPLKTIDDVGRIKDFIKRYKRCAVIGAGPIGLEVAEALKECGIHVEIFEMLNHILPGMMDGDMVSDVEKSIENLHLSKKIVECSENDERIKMVSDDGEKFECDFIVVCTGTKPVLPNIEGGKIETGKMGHIVVDEKCRTSEHGIYAAGDCTEYRDFVTRKSSPVGLGSVAVRQGMTAGINASGGNYEMPGGVINSRVTTIFGWEVAAVGPLSSNLDRNEFFSMKIRTRTKPEYYPGGEQITTKIITDREGKIIGAQMYGREGVAQRLNLFALCVLCEISIDTLSKFENVYSPPVAPTLDVFSIASMAVMKRIHRKSM